MPFKKGQSGNPGGRKKKTPEIIEVEALAQQMSPEALERLAYWMRSDDGPVSVKASTTIIERGFGKPKQTIDKKVETTRYVVEVPPKPKSTEEWLAQSSRPN